MKNSKSVVCVAVLALCLSGCSSTAGTAVGAYLGAGAVLAVGVTGYSLITGNCMNGPCPGTEADLNLRYPNKYEHWIKDGWTVDQRREDILSCGAVYDKRIPDRVTFSKPQLEDEAKRIEGRDIPAAGARLTRKWINCMESKGYVPFEGPYKWRNDGTKN